MKQTTIGVGVIGMGFMGWRHVEAYLRAKASGLPCEVVAVCDPMHGQRQGPSAAGNIRGSGGSLDLERVAEYQDPSHMLFDPSVQLVSVCTPTDTHASIATAALEKRKHVLVEKPVALSAEDVRPVAEAARRAGTLCMPAHCMRFWPGWTWLRDRIADGEFGALKRASFLRAGSAPAWSKEFYGDYARSGGALGDFHIHDADFVLWAIGAPRRVKCEGSLAHPRTTYKLAGGVQATAEAEWSDDPKAPFRMEYTAEFERGVATYRMGRTPLVEFEDESGKRTISVEPETGYDAEVRHIVEAIASGSRELRVTMDDALRVAELLDAERRSLETGDWVEPFA